jgi:ATP-dependent protease HslVU (ClpYQ) ATPase subunit
LLSLLDSIPKKVWSISRMYNILDNVLGINFKISNDWIQILETFTYNFDHIFNTEELDNISDDELMDYLINHISYKTNKNNGNTIKVFDFEKKYIKNTLSYFSDKINYSSLRKVLSYN